MITVSSSVPDIWNGWFLNKGSITDGLSYTFWHSNLENLKAGQSSWMNYDLNTPETITEVIVGVRQGLTLDISKS